MSVLEIIIVVAMGVGLIIYIAVSIYELKHPEIKQKRKEKRAAKKQLKSKRNKAIMRTMKKTCIESTLMWYALTRGVDLWVFRHCMLSKSVGYENYEQTWREISRTKITHKEFEELQYLFRVYTGEK